MLKLRGMRKNKDEKFFEIWTKKLSKDLPNFWFDFLATDK